MSNLSNLSNLATNELLTLQTNLAAALNISIDSVILDVQPGSFVVVVSVPWFVSSAAVASAAARIESGSLVTGLESDFTLLSVSASGVQHLSICSSLELTVF